MEGKDWFKNHLSDAVSRLKSWAAASGSTLPAYANGRVLFEEDMTELAIIHYGPGGRLDVALVGINAALNELHDPTLTGLKVALQPGDQDGRHVFVLTHSSPES